MIDLIVFSVGDNKYAMNIENVQRIVQVEALTNIPNAHKYIDGMMPYEDKVIKVLSFRKLIGMQTYTSELNSLFSSLAKIHEEWMNDLRISIETGTNFSKTFDPHACGLGKWIDSFTAYDDHVVEVLKGLVEQHKQLHTLGGVAYEIRLSDKERALHMLNIELTNIYQHTMGALELFVKELDTVADSLQKLLIYDDKGTIFAIKVDAIDDIAHVKESEFINANNENDTNEFLELEGVLDLDNVLINVIKTVSLPK